MATKRKKRQPRRSRTKSAGQQEAKTPISAQDEAQVTAPNEDLVPLEEEVLVPTGDETRATDRDEVRGSARDEVSVATEDKGAPIDRNEAWGPTKDEAEVPAEDEAQVTPHDKVRFIVGEEAFAAAEDDIEIIAEAEDEVPLPLELENEALLPVGPEASESQQDEVQAIVEQEAPAITPDEASLPITEVAEEEQSLGRRKHARFAVKGGAKGRVAVVWDAVLLNISLGGALIEHTNVVRPGTPSSLELELQGQRIRLRCRVARSVAERIQVQPDGERELVYETGLQFVDASDETLQIIGDYIDALGKGG
ncbi:MAG: PilZ domain-containing protein [Candidatus Methylomirabilales bacterium]